MGMFLYLPHGISTSPYSHLLDPNLWVEIYDVFTRDACSLLGLSVDSPLSVWWVCHVWSHFYTFHTFQLSSCIVPNCTIYGDLGTFCLILCPHYVTLMQLLNSCHRNNFLCRCVTWPGVYIWCVALNIITSTYCNKLLPVWNCIITPACHPLRKVAPVHTAEWPLFLYSDTSANEDNLLRNHIR